MAEIRLDKLDLKILRELDRHSRQSISSIARSVRQGRDRVEYRVDRMIREGVIRRFTPMINFYRLGLTIYKICLKLENDHNRLKAFLKLLERHPKVYWIGECDGSWDVIFTIIASDGFQFTRLQNEILSSISDLIIDSDIVTLVNAHFLQKKYLAPGKGEGWILGGQPRKVEIDTLSSEVLRLLCQDGQITTIELARRLKCSESVIQNRIQKLELEGVIAGYRVELDLALLGMEFFKAQLFLRDYSDEAEKPLRDYSEAHPNITYYIQQLGRCSLELECEVKNYEEYNKVIQDLRERFPKLIRNVETTLIYKESYKWIALN
jgi:DNA-binding Lrp family transcriptional regulator